MWTKLLTLFVLVGTAFGQSYDYIKKRAEFARAIARTEGCYVKGSIPNRYHNCGDLKRMNKERVYLGQIGVGKGGHIIFRDNASGWAALLQQIDKILAGESKFYTPEMTLQQMGKFYAQNSRLWAKNLARNLGVSPSTTLEEYFEIPPRIKVEPKEMSWSNLR